MVCISRLTCSRRLRAFEMQLNVPLRGCILPVDAIAPFLAVSQRRLRGSLTTFRAA